MLSMNIKAAIAIVVLPSLVAGIALAAQDRYSVQVPGGLAFAEFRGYENWQLIAVTHNGDKVDAVLGNPAMIEAYQAGRVGEARRIHYDLMPLYTGIMTRTQGVITTKAALGLLGLPGGPVRGPLIDATPAQIEQLRADLVAGGVKIK